jgi:tRNA uridine 5-carboxymethylaminomethyl modification enzyme
VAELLRIPGVVINDLHRYGADIPELDPGVADAVEVAIKYAGYIDRQQRQIEQFRRLESQRIPSRLRFAELTGLRAEAKEKFARIQPLTLGQASRIPGITSSDVAVLMVHLRSSGGQSQVSSSLQQ